MLARLLHAYIGRKLQNPWFPEQQGKAARVTTRDVVGVFAHGAAASLKGWTAVEVKDQQRQVPWYRRSYFWEGYAFGLAAVQAFRWPRDHPDRGRLVPGYRGMHFTGYGFWNGLALRYPVPGVPLDPRRWRDVEDYVTLSPLLAGGAAFALTESLEDLDRALPRLRPLFERDESWALAAAHGCGRALWFLYMDDPPRIEGVLDRHPELAEALAEGVGIALAYTRVPSRQALEGSLAGFSSRGDSVLRGVGACLAALEWEEPQSGPWLSSLESSRLGEAWRVCHRAAREAAGGSHWYADVTRRARDRRRTTTGSVPSGMSVQGPSPL